MCFNQSWRCKNRQQDLFYMEVGEDQDRFPPCLKTVETFVCGVAVDQSMNLLMGKLPAVRVCVGRKIANPAANPVGSVWSRSIENQLKAQAEVVSKCSRTLLQTDQEGV